MAEEQSRGHNPPTRGRGGGRGGRGGFGGRNATTRRANGDKATAADSVAFHDDSDIAQLRKQFGEKLVLIKELFENWSDADILYALKETDGDVELTATRISDGTISQWGEVSKAKKPVARPKTKPETPTGLVETAGNSRPARGGRSDGGRGGRARGNDRARGSGRGRGTAHPTTNGHRAKENQSIPTEEASAWSGAILADESQPKENNGAPAAVEPATPAISSKPAPEPVVAQAAPRTWASMLRQSTAPKPAPKPKEAPVPKPAEVLEPLPPAEPVVAEPEPQPQAEETSTVVEAPVEPAAPVETVKVVEPEVVLPPPEDNLTKVNLDQIPDESQPPPSPTRASNAADSWDARPPTLPPAVTPLTPAQAQQQASRAAAAASGYAATALKATERPAPRMPTYQRRFLEQEEPVRMPGNREVDRAAVQFGAFSLNGMDDDIDGDREDPETRTQPPAESPAAPRASLPPIAQPAPIPETLPQSQKPVPAPVQPQQQPQAQAQIQAPAATVTATPVAPPTGPASTTSQQVQPQANNQAYGRFPQANSHESASFAQKPYDSFGQQPTSTSATFDSFPATATQAPGPQNSGAFSSGPEYSSYYGADQQSRNAYGAYYGYGQQQAAQNHGEPNATSRPFGSYNASQNDHLSQYPQSGGQQSRYPGATAASADAHNSGHNTPNPVGQNQQQGSAQGSQQPQSNLHQQQPSYPYQQHPYYSSPYYAQYMSQPYAGYGQGGYGGAPYGKGYGQGHQYGMSPQGPFDHASTGTVGFGQSSVGSRETGLSSGMNDYTRSGAGQQSGAPGALGSGGFGGVHDSYGRGTGFPSQGGQGFNATNAPTAAPGSGNDDLKPYGESKTAGGPSPSLATAARPGSTTNASSAASALPPPQSTQQGMGGYGGYPSHLAQGLHGQTGATGYGLGNSSSQGHANSPYGGYGGNQGFSSYYGGGRQGHQGGWGGNYH